MSVTITRILVEGIASNPNQAVTITDQATGIIIGSGSADGTGAFTIPVMYGTMLSGVAAGSSWTQGVLFEGQQSGAAGGVAAVSGTLTQALPLGGSAGGVATAGPSEPVVNPGLGGTAGGTASPSGTLQGGNLPLAGTAAGVAAPSATELTVTEGGGASFSDNFNRADSTTISDGTHPWLEFNSVSIAANVLMGSSDTSRALWNATAANNQFADCKVNAASNFGLFGGSVFGVGPGVRIAADGTAGYFLCKSAWDDGEGGSGSSLRLVRGTGTSIANYDASYASANFLRVEASGDQISCFYKTNAGDSWSALGSAVTDATYASGYVGVALPWGSADDWNGGDL